MVLSFKLSIIKIAFLLCKSQFERNNEVVCISGEDLDQ